MTRRGIRGIRRHENGQVAVLGAIVAVALILIVGLAVDAGISYVDQGALQAGADTSALAGATVLQADFAACRQGGILPYTNEDVASVVAEIAQRSVVAITKVTAGPAVDYVTYEGGVAVSLGPAADYNGPLCLGPGDWTGPVGVHVALGNSHRTPLLSLGGISSASEAASAAAAFGVVQGAAGYAPFVACAQQPVGTSGPVQLGDTVLLASPVWTSAESSCALGPAGFKGFLQDPSPSSITLPMAAGITSGEGDVCGLWPPTIAPGDVILVPLTTSVRLGGGRYQISVEGLVAVRITRYACPIAEGVVTSAADAAKGLVVCPGAPAPACLAAPSDVRTEATVVQLVS